MRRLRGGFKRTSAAPASRATITMKDDMTSVSGKDRKGEPFAVRLGRCADMDELDAFADECDRAANEPAQILATSSWCANQTPEKRLSCEEIARKLGDCKAQGGPIEPPRAWHP